MTTNQSQSLAFGIAVVANASATGVLGQSDLTRYAKSKNAPVLSQLISAPVFMVIGAVIGIVTTSAVADVLGDIYWEPYDLLSAIQAYYNNSSRGMYV
jgi:nucleobase:cation symporter-1, NCS1 family